MKTPRPFRPCTIGAALLFASATLLPSGCTFDFSFANHQQKPEDSTLPFSRIEEMFIYGDILFPVNKNQPKTSIIDNYTKRGLKCLTDNIYHEARGEGPKGMRLVADVTLNRVLSSKYPDTICSVVYQKSQFSWTRNRSTIHELNVYQDAKSIAKEALYRTKDTSMGAVYFYAHRVVKPSWAYHRTTTVVHGGHTFQK